MTSHVLKRELTDVGDDVRAAPPPVVPDFDPPFALRLVDPDGSDPEMLASLDRIDSATAVLPVAALLVPWLKGAA